MNVFNTLPIFLVKYQLTVGWHADGKLIFYEENVILYSSLVVRFHLRVARFSKASN